MLSASFTQTIVAEFTLHHDSLSFPVNSMADERKVRLEDLICFCYALVVKLPCQLITR